MKWSAYVSGSANCQEFLERGLEWGRLYESYKNQPYDPNLVSKQVMAFYADPYIQKRKSSISSSLQHFNTSTLQQDFTLNIPHFTKIIIFVADLGIGMFSIC